MCFNVVTWSMFAVGVSTLVLDGSGQTTDPDVLKLLVKLESDLITVQDELREMRELQEGCGMCTPSKEHTQTPAFMATLTTKITNCSADDPVVFDRVMLNVGSAYDNRHGTFRALTNGTYHLAATLTDAPFKGFFVKFVKNSLTEEIGYLFAGGNGNSYMERSTSIVVHLTAGDDVWLACTGGVFSSIQGGNSGMQHDYHSHFSGFLISED